MECPICGSEIDEEDDHYYECPLCGEYDMADGYLKCPDCENMFYLTGDMWECENCGNEEFHDSVIREPVCECPSCGAVMDGDYCDECGWPDVNLGWIGEEYG